MATNKFHQPPHPGKYPTTKKSALAPIHATKGDSMTKVSPAKHTMQKAAKAMKC